MNGLDPDKLIRHSKALGGPHTQGDRRGLGQGIAGLGLAAEALAPMPEA